MILSIADQDCELRAKFPQFTAVSLTERRAIWEGIVCPSTTSFTLRIDYELPPHLVLKAPTREFYPHVYVIEPRLIRKPKADLGPLPHVWYGKEYQGQPNLCLFHPDKGEWGYDSAIAETTLPDACEWLHSYEFWLVTGRWYGGGENHETQK